MYQQGNIVFTPDGNSVLSPVGNRVSVFDLVKSVLVPGLELRPKSTHASFTQQQVLHLCFPKPQKYCRHRPQSPWEHFDQCRRRCVPRLCQTFNHVYSYAATIQTGGRSSSTSAGALSFIISISKSRSTPSNFRPMDHSSL